MRQLLLAFAGSIAIAACSSSTTDVVFVDELTDGSQTSLCEAFLDDYCTTPAGTGFCADPCIDTACGPAVSNGDVDAECVGVLDTEVEDCGFSGDSVDCSGGGGCMIDALETACNR